MKKVVTFKKEVRKAVIKGLDHDDNVIEKSFVVVPARSDYGYLSQINENGFTPCKLVSIIKDYVVYEMPVEQFIETATIKEC